MMTLAHSWVLLASLTLATAATAQTPTWQGRLDRSGDVLRVLNPDTPARPPETVIAEELWRLTGDEDDHLLGSVTSIEVGPDGRTHILDFQQKEVALYDESGCFVGTMGREGEGPGEFRRPRDLAIDDDGVVSVLQYFPGRIFRLTPGGDPLPDQPLPLLDGGPIMLWNMAYGPHWLVMHQYTVEVSDDGGLVTRRALRSVDADGDPVATYCEREIVRRPGDNIRYEGVYGDFIRDWAVGPTGRVAVRSAFDRYELTVYEPRGGVERVITRTYERRQRRAQVVQALQSWQDEHNEGRRWRANVGPIVHRVSECDGDIQEFAMRDDGSIWVLTSRGALDVPPGVMGVFDVLDNEGRFMRQVTVEGEGDYWTDAFYISADRLFVVTNVGVEVPGWCREGNEDVEWEDGREVICYRLGW